MAKVRYLVTRNSSNNYYYVRKIPKTILADAPKGTASTWQMPLGVTTDSKQSKVMQAWEQADELYTLHIKSLQFELGGDALTETEIDKLARQKIAKLKMRPLSFLKQWRDNTLKPDGTGTLQELSLILTKGKSLDALSDAIQAEEYEKLELMDFAFPPFTEDHKVLLRATDLLVSAKSQVPTTLYMMYEKYKAWLYNTTNPKKQQEIISANKGLRDRHLWLQLIMKHCRDVHINSETSRELNRALREFVREKEAAGVKARTIRGQCSPLSKFATFIEDEAYEQDIAVKIRLPRMKNEKEPPKERATISIDEQHILCKHIIDTEQQHAKQEDNARSKLQLALGCICLLELQGGMMVSEIERMQPSNIKLTDTATPFIIVDGEVKRKARRRIVPVVVGVDYIRRHLAKTQKWLNKTKTANHSATLINFIHRVVGNHEITPHSLRHGGQMNGQINDVNADMVAIIFGWSVARVGGNVVQAKYGASNWHKSEVVEALTKISKKLNQHLLQYNDPRADQYSNSNVVKLQQQQRGD